MRTIISTGTMTARNINEANAIVITVDSKDVIEMRYSCESNGAA